MLKTVRHCGSLNVSDPHKLIGSGILGGVALLEEVCHCGGGGFEVFFSHAVLCDIQITSCCVQVKM